MSKWGKGLLLLAFIVLLAGMAIKGYFPQPWVQWAPLGGFILLVIATVAVDFAFFKEFFGLRTTRHGMNMGTLILLVLAVLIGVNFVAFNRNKKWDLTEEGLNSLSPQTIKIIKDLKSEVKFLGFFVENSEQETRKKMTFQSIAKMFSDESDKIKIETWDPQKRPDLAKMYGVEFSGTVVLLLNGKQHTVTEASEETLVNGLVKLTREKNKILYFLAGHGEVDLANSEGPGGSTLKKALEDASYEVKSLNLVEQPTFPEDADAIIVLGPKRALLDGEEKMILDYIKKGGKALFAGDPGEKHNLAKMMTPFGITFDNNYIIDQMGQLIGASAAMAIGIIYSSSSDITKDFGKNMSGFQLASSLSKVQQVNNTFAYDEIVKSSPASFSKNQIGSQVRFDEKTDKKGPFAIGYKVSGTWPGEEKDKKEFSALFYGDSDFFTNQLLNFQLNRDLALNSISFLAKDTEMISVRPKQMKGTTLTMTDNQSKMLFWAFFVPFPFFFLLIGFFFWFARRHA